MKKCVILGLLLTISNQEAIAQTTRLIVPTDAGIQVPFGAVGDVLVAGPGTSQIQDSSLASYANVPTNLYLTNNFTLGTSSTNSQTQSLFFWNGTITGTSTNTSQLEAPVYIRAVDSGAGNGNNMISLITARLQMTGATGLRNAIQSYISLDQAPAVGDTSLQNYVSMTSLGYSVVSSKSGLVGGANFSGYAGSLWGTNPHTWIGTSDASKNAVHWLGLYGTEIDTNIFTGSDAAERYGIFIVSSGTTVGTIDDAAVEMTGTDNYGIEFGGIRHTWVANNAFIASVAQTQGGTSTPSAPYGVDFRNATFSTAAWASPGIVIDGSGNTTGVSYRFNGTTGTAAGNELYMKASNTISVSINGIETANWSVNNGSFFGNQNGLTNYQFGNSSAGVAAQIRVSFGNSTNASEANLILNGGAFSGGLGANAFAINGLGGIWLQGNGTTGLNITSAGVPQLPSVAAGTPVASLCLDASNNIIKKTTAGSCI